MLLPKLVTKPKTSDKEANFILKKEKVRKGGSFLGQRVELAQLCTLLITLQLIPADNCGIQRTRGNLLMTHGSGPREECYNVWLGGHLKMLLSDFHCREHSPLPSCCALNSAITFEPRSSFPLAAARSSMECREDAMEDRP